MAAQTWELFVGDSRRFHEFSALIANRFPKIKPYPIADIAGGKGYLNLSLKEKGFSNVTTFDKRNKFGRVRNISFRYSFFSHLLTEFFSLVIGMHPDEGTDELIMYAVINRIPWRFNTKSSAYFVDSQKRNRGD